MDIEKLFKVCNSIVAHDHTQTDGLDVLGTKIASRQEAAASRCSFPGDAQTPQNGSP